MKKVLIITYYWPPSGGAGVQRVLKLVKYLRQNNWEPVIYTADEAEYPILDASLAKDIPEGVKVIRKKLWEPYSFYKKFIGQKKDQKVYSGFLSENKKSSFAQKVSVWIRGNFFIPDARCFWIKPSVRFLSEYLKQNPVDAIISSGPPHTTHLIARGVKRKTKLPWIADFRDPWTQIDFYEQLMLTSVADAKHKRLERSVLKEADKVITVSWNWAKDLEEIGKRKIEIITNGFDEDDFSASGSTQPDTKFSMSHIGSLNGDRNAANFWLALKELCADDAQFKTDLVIRLIGKNDFAVYQSIEQNGLQEQLEKIEYIPHSETGKYQQRSSVLLLFLNNTPNVLGIIPGKLFEYLAARRPILVIGNSNGDSARIVTETNAGAICDFDEKEKMKTTIKDFYTRWKKNELTVSAAAIEKYSRKTIAQKFAVLLNEITS